MRLIGLIIRSSDFEEVKELLKCIFIVSLNEEDGFDLDKAPTQCKNAKNYLKQRIADNITMEADYIDGTNQLLDELVEISYDNILKEDGTNNIFNVIKNIYESCLEDSLKTNNGSNDNMQYSPNIAKKLLHFCKLLPTWLAIMTPYFGYGNSTELSSTSESLFNELKNRVFNHKTLPIRLDEFVQNHVSFIMGSMKLIKGKLEYNNSEDDQSEKEEKKEYKKEHSDNSIQYHTYDNINEVENRRGHGKPSKIMKHSYSTPYRSILFYNDNSKTKSPIIGILRNGNIQD